MIRQERNKLYEQGLKACRNKNDLWTLQRELAQKELFFLLTFVLNRPDCNNDWIYNRIVEVQNNPDGYIDLWARDHYKTSIITFGLTIKDILNDPEKTFVILSYNIHVANKFLFWIKSELETNVKLKWLFPEIFWENPKNDAPKWSVERGIIVKRKGNPKEATIESYGLVDSQPVSGHWDVRIYNDIVIKESVRTTESIEKTTEAWELSLNLGKRGGVTRYEGTRYHYADTYSIIITRGAAKPRIYPATEDGTFDGKPVLITREELAEKRSGMEDAVFAAQMLLNPKAGDVQGFKEEWLMYWPNDSRKGMNIYILCDPAREKKKESDFTVFWVIGVGADGNIYILDIVRDRLNLKEKWNILFMLHKGYRPLKTGYERYGMQADDQYFLQQMNQSHYRFKITELAGTMPKNDRIRRLSPLFEDGKIWLPEKLYRTNYQGKNENLVKIFVDEEYKAFPHGGHDDMLDALSRIMDEEIQMTTPQDDKYKPFGVEERDVSEYDPLRWGLEEEVFV